MSRRYCLCLMLCLHSVGPVYMLPFAFCSSRPFNFTSEFVESDRLNHSAQFFGTLVDISRAGPVSPCIEGPMRSLLRQEWPVQAAARG